MRNAETEDAHPQAQKLYQKPVPGDIGGEGKRTEHKVSFLLGEGLVVARRGGDDERRGRS